jgi:hypothetical protein
MGSSLEELPGVIVLLVLGGLLVMAVLSLCWLMTTDCCCMPYTRCCIRRFVRPVLKKKDSHLKFDYHEIDEQLVMGRLPKLPEQLDELRTKLRVSAVVTLNETWELPPYLAFGTIMDKPIVSTGGDRASPKPDSQFHFCHLPTPDYTAPRQKDIWTGVRWMQQQFALGRTSYVHCNAGRGRSAVIVLCFLVLTKGFTAQEAYDFVVEKRQIANLPRLCGTRPQWRAVKRFARKVSRQRKAAALASSSGLGDEEAALLVEGGGSPLVHQKGQRGKQNRVAPLPDAASGGNNPSSPPRSFLKPASPSAQ